jgi:hypothetical protein
MRCFCNKTYPDNGLYSFLYHCLVAQEYCDSWILHCYYGKTPLIWRSCDWKIGLWVVWFKIIWFLYFHFPVTWFIEVLMVCCEPWFTLCIYIYIFIYLFIVYCMIHFTLTHKPVYNNLHTWNTDLSSLFLKTRLNWPLLQGCLVLKKRDIFTWIVQKII